MQGKTLRKMARNDIPRNLMYGIPAMVERAIDRTYRGKEGKDLWTEDEDVKDMMGVPKAKARRLNVESKNIEAGDLYNSVESCKY